MKRSYLLFGIVLLVFAAAVALRIRSRLVRNDVTLVADDRLAADPLPIHEPRDYVADSWVSTDEVDHGPERIISLAPSITEILCALGLLDRLVGRTQYCQYPPGVEEVPVVGALMDANFERIKSLAPDLVLTTNNSGRLIDGLKKLGIRYEAVPHGSLDQVYVAIEQIGKLCNRPKTARALVESIRKDINLLQSEAKRLKVKQWRVLVVLGRLPVPPKAIFVAGPGLFLDDLLELAGHTNAGREVLDTHQGAIPLEVLRVLDPEVILFFGRETSAEEMTDLYRRWSEVGSLQAIDNQRVYRVGGLEWLSAGPRIAIELRRFISVLSNR